MALQLLSGEVHTWCVPLDVRPEICDELYGTLTDDERQRSARLRFERDRRRYIVARGALRDLLGRYVGARPSEVRFAYNAFGKPELGPAFGKRLRFNLAHSEDLALVAVALGADIGVDVEYVETQADFAEIAGCFFTRAEVDELNGVPKHLHNRAYFDRWTKKEAYLKARGRGLADLELPPAKLRDWSVFSLQPAPGYVGALAIRGRGWQLQQRLWDSLAEDGAYRIPVVNRSFVLPRL